MEENKVTIGFMGAGGIARAHAFALNSLRYYYDNPPLIKLGTVCSASKASRESFASKYGFSKAVSPSDFVKDETIDTVFILGPNNVHFESLCAALSMPAVKRIYIEKPVCANTEEAEAILPLISQYPGITVQVGFQFLFSATIIEALKFWRKGELGNPIHFEAKYYHGDYLKKDYRSRRTNRLTPCPDGGAMADLGSHAISLVMAFLGNDVSITGAIQAGRFEDVPEGSDLFSLITLHDNNSGAAGTLAASRVSSGTGDRLTLDIYAGNGALSYSTATPDFFEFYLEKSGVWSRVMAGSNYKPVTSFPSGHVPPGWLRSMIHAHYVFLTGYDQEQFVPGIEHGIDVQRIVTQTAIHLERFRNNT